MTPPPQIIAGIEKASAIAKAIAAMPDADLHSTLPPADKFRTMQIVVSNQSQFVMKYETSRFLTGTDSRRVLSAFLGQ